MHHERESLPQVLPHAPLDVRPHHRYSQWEEGEQSQREQTRLGRERSFNSAQADDGTAHGRPAHRYLLPHIHERDRVEHPFGGHQRRHDRLPHWHPEGHDQAKRRSEPEDAPEVQRAHRHQQRCPCSDGDARDLGAEEQQAPVEAVGQDARVQPEYEHGRPQREDDQPDYRSRAHGEPGPQLYPVLADLERQPHQRELLDRLREGEHDRVRP